MSYVYMLRVLLGVYYEASWTVSGFHHFGFITFVQCEEEAEMFFILMVAAQFSGSAGLIQALPVSVS